jgi:cytochrome c-type biogenesis protein CcmF
MSYCYIRPFSNDQFIGENLWFGHFGHLLIIISLCFTLFSSLAYFISFFSKEQAATSSWIKIARKLFYVHTASIIGIFTLLFFMMLRHHYEYNYVWRHTSNSLPVYYIISAFWEGQEGSFLLWMFWHAILGCVLMHRAKDWESGTMAIVSLVQFCLSTMIAGLMIFGYKLGSNPFTLLRDEMNAPIFSRPEYLSLVKDGNGLNVLLQNYWMVIHPPILFLGFASTLIPFAYAFSALLKRDFYSWVKEALPWALFSGGALGLGIMMGGAWAYEALSFGGFWAWDPVENASLVPWLTLVAGIHTMLIYRATKHSLKISFFLIIFQFLFVLYSTFLTRSGILGDTSVHSFTDLGMTGQLVIFMALFGVPAMLMMAFYWSRIEEEQKEETIQSREFWMFIGALIFIFSFIQIAYTTSIPVWNTLFNFKEKIAPPVNAEAHYNKIQIWIGILLGLGMAIIQFLRYKSSQAVNALKQLLIPILGSVFIAILIGISMDISPVELYKIEIKKVYEFKFISAYWLLLISGILAVNLNLFYLLKVLKGKWKIGGGSIAHIGFGLMLVGILISQYKQEAISMNLAGIDFGKGFDDKEKESNILLYKNKPERMGVYHVTYKGAIQRDNSTFYEVEYVNMNDSSETFSLFPEAKLIKEGENTRINANPDTKHYLTKDIFTHINSVPDQSEENGIKNIQALKYDTMFLSSHRAILQDVIAFGKPNTDNILKIRAQIAIGDANNITDTLYPEYIVDMIKSTFNQIADSSNDGNILITINKIIAEENKLDLSFVEKNTNSDWIIMKAIVFPYINVLWLGCLVMVAGFLISMRDKRIKQQHLQNH